MKFATRINSFKSQVSNTIDILKKIVNIDGIDYVDLNYPEHFQNVDLNVLKKTLKECNLKVNGLALRFREEFQNGELGNQSDELSNKALRLCEEAFEVCRELKGNVVTIWLGFDGFDYSFQLNYENAWKKIVKSMKILTEKYPDIKLSIEYKPFDPRCFSLVSDIGSTLLLVDDVDAKNIGVTLDFCHMLMKGENPAYGLYQAAHRNKLFGIHLNDGHRLNDSGMIVGSVNFIQTLEFLYYLKKFNYDGVIYFDTFPVREDPSKEVETNIKMTNHYFNLIDKLGMEKIQNIIDENDGIKAQEIFLECFK